MLGLSSTAAFACVLWPRALGGTALDGDSTGAAPAHDVDTGQDSPAGMTTVWAGFEQPHRAHCVQTCMQA